MIYYEKKKTYKTDHPTIKEITIGDKFVLNNREILTFVEYCENTLYPFKMNNKMSYRKDLKFSSIVNPHRLDIKQKYITLKEKLNLI